jgi:hypothetical protein
MQRLNKCEAHEGLVSGAESLGAHRKYKMCILYCTKALLILLLFMYLPLYQITVREGEGGKFCILV